MQGIRKKTAKERNIVQQYGFKVNKNEIEIPKNKQIAPQDRGGRETIIETQTWIFFFRAPHTE